MTLPPNLQTIFRNAIDLNRYSNSVARKIINQYNLIIVDSVNQLQGIDEARAPVKAARLRAIIAQLKDSLATWAGDSTEITALELQGLAELQSEFVQDQLRKALPAGSRNLVRTVEISPQFAQSVVSTDPTQINLVALSDDLFAAVEGPGAAAGATRTFSLTATQGSTITLPNGQVVQKAFRGLAESQAEKFGQLVRQGLLTGEPTADIARRLKGTIDKSDLDFADFGPLSEGQRRAAGLSIEDFKKAGGDLTRVTSNQIVTLVRTSVNQVANAAANSVYEANLDVTKKYKYVATLDSRTSPICRALDGKEFEYGKGPQPPQHFGCRSTIVPIVDDDILPPSKVAKRASAYGPVSAELNYGQWLLKQGNSEQQKVLGSKAPYFRKIARKYGAKNAMAKMIREDGSELSLDQLRSRYGAVKKR